MGTKSEDVDASGAGGPVSDYCRDIEAYLCRKNDGHLIRVVGPSFDLVSGWAGQGVPLKVAFKGIDRYFERYYAKGPRRRPVKIDFCDADVLDVFDEWKRATGVARTQAPETAEAQARTPSLHAHLERVLMRLSSARASGSIGPVFDASIDRVSHELDNARASPRGVRGEARRALVDRLVVLDAELIDCARGSLDEPARAALAQEAEEELRVFRSGMSSDEFARARERAIERLVRERFKLPIVALV